MRYIILFLKDYLMYYVRIIQLVIITLHIIPAFAQPPMGVPVIAHQVTTDTVVEKITAIGTFQPEETVIIRSEIPGRITHLHFSEGEYVKKGKILVNLDSSEYEASLAESTTAVTLNQLNFDRVQELSNKKLASRKDYDEIRAQLDESRARQTLNKVRLEKTKITAPFSGIVGLNDISEGAYIQAGEDLVTLIDRSIVKLDFRIPERYLSQISIGQSVNIQVDAYPQQTFVGKVYAFDLAVDQETRTLLLRARVPNAKDQLYPGMFARVNLVLANRANAVLVPEQAIVPQGTDSFVFKVVTEKEASKVALTKIVLGLRRTGDVEVLEGLEAGDKVITDGQMKLYDGADVMIINEMSEAH